MITEELQKHFLESIVSAVADGCNVEQRVLFNCSKANPSGAAPADVLCPNLLMINRDRPHRFRSVQRGFWNQVDVDVLSLLEELVTGQRSLCRLLETSIKFSKLFQDNQKRDRANHVYTGPDFARVLRTFQYAEQRFNSRSKPLYRIFRLLPTVIQTLSDITSMTDDPHDSNWAESLLLRFSGTKGYETLVTAAVVADAMMAFQPAIRLEDAAAADFSLSAVEAAKLKQTLWALLYHGGIFLEECSETLTHTVLRSIRNKTVFLRAGTPKQSAMVLHWPLPGADRDAPVRRAKEPVTIIRMTS